MANPATAIFRQLKYKAETTYGSIPSPLTGSQALRRVEFSPDLTKDTYQSNELRVDQQVADFRHGARRAGGTLRGELSPKAYADFFAALLRKDFVATTPAAGVGITVSGTGAPYTVTRSAGSYLADGFKVGDVIRLSVGSLNAANVNKNLVISALTATAATVYPLNGQAMFAEGPVTGCTITAQGKRSWIPATGHTDKSFSIESWFADLGKSEMYTGMKPTKVDLALPSTGMATADFTFAGQNMTPSATEQFTSPTAAPTFGVSAAVNGILLVGGVKQVAIRDLSISIDGTFGGNPVVGSDIIPFAFPGRIVVTGQFTAYLDSVTLRDAFINETALGLSAIFSSDNSATSDFVGFTLPRIKLGSATKDDAQDGITQTFSFQALLNGSGGPGTDSEATTIVIQDSQA